MLVEAEAEVKGVLQVRSESVEEVVAEGPVSNRSVRQTRYLTRSTVSSAQAELAALQEVLLLAQTVWPVETARWQRIIRIHRRQASLQLPEGAEEDREDFRQVHAVVAGAEEVEVKV